MDVKDLNENLCLLWFGDFLFATFLSVALNNNYKPESTGQKRKIKEIMTKGKTIQTKVDILKQRKKILPTSGAK